MKTDQKDKKDQNNPASQKQDLGNRQRISDRKSEKYPSLKKSNDEDEHDKKHKDYTAVLGLDKIHETY